MAVGHSSLFQGVLGRRNQNTLEVAVSPRSIPPAHCGRERGGIRNKQVPGLFLNSPLVSNGLENSVVACPKVVN